MALTDIGIQKTPGRPAELTFGANTGLPSPIQPVVLIGHRGAGASSGGSGIANYSAVIISNVGDSIAAGVEAAANFGSGSELAKMVIAAVNAVEDGGTFPPIVCIPLASSDVGFGSSNQAIATLDKLSAGFVVSPYDGDSDTAHTTQLITEAQAMSGPQRVENNQFGTCVVAANFAQATPGSLHKYDSQFFMGAYMRDLGALGANPYTLGEFAAGFANAVAANAVPFNPMNNIQYVGATAPANSSDFLSIGAGQDSETVLNQGWSPLKIQPNGNVAFVRTVTSRLTSNGTTPVNAYYDIQDFQSLYFFRQTVWTRENQPDFSNTKASVQTAKNLKSEILRLMQLFETQGMFQATAQLAALVQVQRNVSDRTRFDVLIPVNVVPGLQVVANNIQAGTLFDTFTV